MFHSLRWCDAGWRVALNRLAHYNWLGFVRYNVQGNITVQCTHCAFYMLCHFNEDDFTWTCFEVVTTVLHLSGTRSCTTRQRRWGRPQIYLSSDALFLVPHSLTPLNNFLQIKIHICSQVIDSLDVKSRKIFPGMFIFLNLAYWGYYWGYSRD